MSEDHLTYTERYEESLTGPQQKVIKQHQQYKQQYQPQQRKPKKVVIDLDEAKTSRDRYGSVESLDSNDVVDGSEPTRTSRDDVLESLGYKPKRLPKPTNTNTAAVARNLCHLCGRRVYPMERIDIGELYHRGCFKCHTCGLQLTLKTFCRVTSTSSKNDTEVFCKTHVPKLEAAYDKEALEIQAAIKAQKGASDKVLRQYEPSPNKYDPDAIEFEHARKIKKNQKVKRRKSLKTTEDYLKFGVFEAQEELEKKHRKEEDELYNEMYEERKLQLKNLESNLAIEKEKTVKELVAWFEDQNVSENEKKTGILKVEQYYKEQRELKIKDLMEKMHLEEQEAVARLTEKHAQEMLYMIEQKDKEVGETLEKRSSQYARRTSYKDMEYLSGGDVDDDDENDKDDEGSKSGKHDGDEDGDDDAAVSYDDDDIEEGIQQHRYEIYDLDTYGKATEHVGHKKKSKDKKLEIPFFVETPEAGKQKEKVKSQSEQNKDAKSTSATERHEIANKDEVAENQISKPKRKKVKKPNEKIPVIETEEIADRNLRKNKKSSTFQGYQSQERNELLDPNKKPINTINLSFEGDEKVERSEKETVVRKNDESLKTKHRLDENESKSSVPQTRFDTRTRENDEHDDDVKGGDFDDVTYIDDGDDEGANEPRSTGDNDADSDDELETIEDRIKKVLKNSNLKITPNKLKEKATGESKVEVETVASADKSGTGSGKDRNIWKDTSSSRLSSGHNSSDQKLHNSSNDSLNERRKSRPSKVNYDDGEDDDSPRLSMPPNAEPPLCRKSKLYKDPEIFQEFDKQAFEEAKKDPTSFTDLVRKLSYNCTSDLQKVRAIFRWITAKDLNKMDFSRDLTTNTPMGLLRGIKTGTETYHNLFKRLCSYVGIHCEIISGYSKGVGYRPGSRFKGTRFRNQWTAVWIKDSWRFINCNWGARHVKQPDDQQLTYKIDEFYFLTDPEDHIQQHFPDDPKWQLLRRPVTLDDFVRMPVVKSPFFNNRLAFTSRVESVLKTSSDGFVELKLYIPHLMNFACKLLSKDHIFPEESLANRSFIRYIGNTVVFATRIPQAGRYFWDIFVGKNWQSESLDNACSFLVYNSALSPKAYQISSYPSVTSFGHTPYSEKYGLTIFESFDPYIICTGSTIIEFFLIHQSNVKISLELSYFSQTNAKEIECNRYTMIHYRNKSELHCLVRCPEKGHYVLSLLATTKTSTYHMAPILLYRCFLDCRVASDRTKILPHTTNRWKECRLLEPLDGDLPMNTTFNFKLECSANVQEVFIGFNDNWYALQKQNNNNSNNNKVIWQGTLNTGPKSTKLVIYGRYESDSEKLVPFVEYFVKEPTLADEVHALFRYT